MQTPGYEYMAEMRSDISVNETPGTCLHLLEAFSSPSTSRFALQGL